MTETIRVEVAWGDSERQVLLAVSVPAGCTVAEAIEASGIRDEVNALEVAADRVGIFGRKARLDSLLKEGDRVEIYRPLIADPKDVRRARAEAQKES